LNHFILLATIHDNLKQIWTIFTQNLFSQMSEFHMINTIGELVPKAWRLLLPAFMSRPCLGFDAIDCLLHTVLQARNGKRFFLTCAFELVMFNV
jgi:hypothetical protein